MYDSQGSFALELAGKEKKTRSLLQPAAEACCIRDPEPTSSHAHYVHGVYTPT
jgi:hypothetical protein